MTLQTIRDFLNGRRIYHLRTWKYFPGDEQLIGGRLGLTYGTGSQIYIEICNDIVALAIKLSLYFDVGVIIFYFLNKYHCGDMFLDFMIV